MPRIYLYHKFIKTVTSDLYYIAFPGDRRYLKMLVAFVFVLEVVQTILATHDVFGALASGWGTPDALDHDYFSPIDVPIMSPIRMCRLLFNKSLL